MDLNKLITTIQGLSSDNEGDLKQLKTNLNKFEEVLVKSVNVLDDALTVLDPNRHSLGWLFILYVFKLHIFVYIALHHLRGVFLFIFSLFYHILSCLLYHVVNEFKLKEL